jgi:hypothetical protein
MDRQVLSDGQWAKMEPLCLGKPGDPGRSGKNNRLFVEAVLRRSITALHGTGSLRFHPRCYYRPDEHSPTESWPATTPVASGKRLAAAPGRVDLLPGRGGSNPATAESHNMGAAGPYPGGRGVGQGLRPGPDRRPGLSQAQPLGCLAGRHQTLVQLAQRPGPTGECVGTAGQAARLQRIGCDTGQHWLYSRAVAPDMIDELITSGPARSASV